MLLLDEQNRRIMARTYYQVPTGLLPPLCTMDSSTPSDRAHTWMRPLVAAPKL